MATSFTPIKQFGPRLNELPSSELPLEINTHQVPMSPARRDDASGDGADGEEEHWRSNTRFTVVMLSVFFGAVLVLIGSAVYQYFAHPEVFSQAISKLRESSRNK